jgi:xanthine dehydrogenase accessory factor
MSKTPLFDVEEVIDQAGGWRIAGRGVALATVVATWGSSPRPVGSQMAINADGVFVGSVSGGCLEGALVREGLEVIEEGKPRLMNFSVSDDEAWGVGLACGGSLIVYVEKLEALSPLFAAQRPMASVTRLSDGVQCVVGKDSVSGELPLAAEELAKARDCLAHFNSTMIDDGLFCRVYSPPQRLFVVGAVHITQALVPMAKLAGFDVTVIDPRRAFASEDRFPGISLTHDWPDEALDKLVPDGRTAIVVLSHDPKIDDPALEKAIRSQAYYIGALGSRKSHAKRLARLAERGFTEAECARIQGPVGLSIGAISPAEIAVSILAAMIAAKYGK